LISSNKSLTDHPESTSHPRKLHQLSIINCQLSIINYQLSIVLLLSLFFSNTVFAQLDAGPNDTINPGVPVTLKATYGNPGTPVILGDDDVAGPFPIGFSFSFFGNNFTEVYIAANGWMSFTANPNSAGERVPVTIPTTNALYPKNVIMAPWIDLLPKTSDTYVFYLSEGIAPNRQLLVMWCQVPMWSLNESDCRDSVATYQVVLHEGSNTIEDQILTKKDCPVSYANHATLGIQNGTGTIGFAVPGRNNTSWTASKEGWLYTPVSVDSFAITSIPFHLQPMVPGNKIVFNWYEGSKQIATDSTVTVTPKETTWYTVYLDLCTGITLKDSVLVVVRGPIPNAFTPNGDGLNDKFRILGTPAENITEYNFRIFNRWGQIIFETNNIDDAWDGTAKGQICPAGVYVWEIFYRDNNKTKITNKGTVMLLR
jgi:gliding motility-associated-like protein